MFFLFFLSFIYLFILFIFFWENEAGKMKGGRKESCWFFFFCFLFFCFFFFCFVFFWLFFNFKNIFGLDVTSALQEKFTFFHSDSSGGSRISCKGHQPGRGCQLPRQLRFVKFVCQNERIGTPWGGGWYVLPPSPWSRHWVTVPKEKVAPGQSRSWHITTSPDELYSSHQKCNWLKKIHRRVLVHYINLHFLQVQGNDKCVSALSGAWCVTINFDLFLRTTKTFE